MKTEDEKKAHRAKLWADWYKRNPRTPEKKSEKNAKQKQWRADNPQLAKQQARERYLKDPKTASAKVQKWRKEHPEQWARIQRACALKAKYGISLADYETMLEDQQARCKICDSTDPQNKNRAGQSPHFAVDHDHSTGAVRGLLCGPCNTALGMFQDKVERLQAAIRYLQE